MSIILVLSKPCHQETSETISDLFLVLVHWDRFGDLAKAAARVAIGVTQRAGLEVSLPFPRHIRHPKGNYRNGTSGNLWSARNLWKSRCNWFIGPQHLKSPSNTPNLPSEARPEPSVRHCARPPRVDPGQLATRAAAGWATGWWKQTTCRKISGNIFGTVNYVSDIHSIR